jgi:hypothetical protein
VCLCQRGKAEVRVVQGGRSSWAAEVTSQLPVGKLLLTCRHTSGAGIQSGTDGSNLLSPATVGLRQSHRSSLLSSPDEGVSDDIAFSNA